MTSISTVAGWVSHEKYLLLGFELVEGADTDQGLVDGSYHVAGEITVVQCHKRGRVVHPVDVN